MFLGVRMSQSAVSREAACDTMKALDASLEKLPAFDSLHWMWQNWSSQLDNSTYRYVLADEYEIVSKTTGSKPRFVEGRCGPITMRFLGKHTKSEDHTVGCLGPPEMAVKNDKSEFIQLLCEDLKDPIKEQYWNGAHKAGLEYFRKHRRLVRHVGEMLGVNMDDHDLTKTKIVLLALAYMWNWPVEKDDIMKKASRDVVTSGHLEREDHHPQFLGGQVAPDKLFCDRLAVHLQKDADDGLRGWDIDKWIPEDLQNEWREFKGRNQHRNLYEVLDMPDPPLPRVCVLGQP